MRSCKPADRETETSEVAATSMRGHSVENRHRAHVAVTDASGKLLYTFGDPWRMTLIRSAAKPAQALAVLESGAFNKFRFDAEDLALMCASHSSEPRHIRRAKRMLAKIALPESDLRCGGHPAISEDVNRTWIKNDFVPGPICNNCSGKHIGMLAAAMALGEPIATYNMPENAIQQRVRSVISELCNLTLTEVEWAIDGCNLPTPAVPLDRLAFLYAQLASAAQEQAGSVRVDTSSRVAALSSIFRSMTTYPELVGGEGRFCTELMRAFEGSLVGKLGAEASYGVGIPDGPATAYSGAGGSLGVAVKIEDGNLSVLYAVVCSVLDQLLPMAGGNLARLQHFWRPTAFNTANVAVGGLEISTRLRKLESKSR